MNHKLMLSVMLTLGMCLSAPVDSSGPFVYVTPFFDEPSFDDMLLGDFSDKFHDTSLTPLIVYLHLTGKFTAGHAALFRAVQIDQQTRPPLPQHKRSFTDLLSMEGYPPVYFYTWKHLTRTDTENGTANIIHYNIYNCLEDAFRVASETLTDRRMRYGSNSPQLSRWIQAQIKVFNHCGTDIFDPPDEPQPYWQPLEKHDRRYQIAASTFYQGQYLQAARLFREIGETENSPWSGLSRYLVGRSLVREASVNERDRVQYLQQALAEYRLLAEDSTYLSSFPWLPGQIRYVEAKLDPIRVLNNIEQKIIAEPETVTVEDVRDYQFLDFTHKHQLRNNSTQYAAWLNLTKAPVNSGSASRKERLEKILAHWRVHKSPEWLFLALIQVQANTDEQIVTDLLAAAANIEPETPGYHVMLEHRIRLNGLSGNIDTALRLAHYQPPPGAKPTTRGQRNRLRQRGAELSTNWTDYFRLASLKPVDLPWSDNYVRSLAAERFNHVTRETTLFAAPTTRMINNYFTPEMILDTISLRSLSDYQRGRLGIAGWTKALLLDDLKAAMKLSPSIRQFVPRLQGAFKKFEAAEDKHIEAALIVLENPAFSPRLWPGAGRIQASNGTDFNGPIRPAPDYVALPLTRNNWWCPKELDNVHLAEQDMAGSRFAHYDTSQRALIRQLKAVHNTSVSVFFGPHVLRWANADLDNPRVPRALHRLVFATRYACERGPESISRQAYQLLHKHFPDSEWAEKTPHWFG